MKKLTISVVTLFFSCVVFAQGGTESISSRKCQSFCESKETCSNVIAEKITMNWSIPPVNEIDTMLAVLKISLAQNGMVENIFIKKSSGNEKFDKSAIQAVKRVGTFCEIQGLKIEDYEKYFKVLTFTFSPQSSRN